ncbi:MAG: hypothetical protein ABEK12_01090, partial [Candidatus Nanohaloarchaea archaeon]
YDRQRAERRLSDATLADIRSMGTWLARAAVQNRDALGPALGKQGVQSLIATAVYGFLWPDPYPDLTENRVTGAVGDAGVVYYNGAGNRSAWIFPNTPDSLTRHGVIPVGRYNGSNAVRPWELPSMRARVVVDDSDGATAPGKRTMWRAALQHGAAAYIGTTGENHVPYASEISTTFFRRGRTAGEGLRRAVNALRRADLPGIPPDPFRQEMLHSYRLIGDPSMPKDPVRPDRRGTTRTRCRHGRCTVTYTVTPEYTVVEQDGRRVLRMPADRHLLFGHRPIVPLFGDRLTLPGTASIRKTTVATESRILADVTVPRLMPPGNTTAPSSLPRFPPVPAAVNTSRTMRNRTSLSIRHAGYQVLANGSVRVYTRITVNATYRAPVAVRTVTATRDTVTVRAWSRRPGNATATLTAGNRTAARTVRRHIHLPDGDSRHVLTIPAGNWTTTDLSLSVHGHTAGPATARIPRPPEQAGPGFHPPASMELVQDIGRQAHDTIGTLTCTEVERIGPVENLPCLKGGWIDTDGV